MNMYLIGIVFLYFIVGIDIFIITLPSFKDKKSISIIVKILLSLFFIVLWPAALIIGDPIFIKFSKID